MAFVKRFLTPFRENGVIQHRVAIDIAGGSTLYVYPDVTDQGGIGHRLRMSYDVAGQHSNSWWVGEKDIADLIAQLIYLREDLMAARPVVADPFNLAIDIRYRLDDNEGEEPEDEDDPPF